MENIQNNINTKSNNQGNPSNPNRSQHHNHPSNHPVKRLVLHSHKAAALKRQQIQTIINNRKQREFEASLLNKLKNKSTDIFKCFRCRRREKAILRS